MASTRTLSGASRTTGAPWTGCANRGQGQRAQVEGLEVARQQGEVEGHGRAVRLVRQADRLLAPSPPPDELRGGPHRAGLEGRRPVRIREHTARSQDLQPAKGRWLEAQGQPRLAERAAAEPRMVSALNERMGNKRTQ